VTGTFGEGTFGEGTFGDQTNRSARLQATAAITASGHNITLRRAAAIAGSATISTRSLRVSGAGPALRDLADAGRLRSTLRLRHYVQVRVATVVITDSAAVAPDGVFHPMTPATVSDVGTVAAAGQHVVTRVPVTAIGTWRS